MCFAVGAVGVVVVVVVVVGERVSGSRACWSSVRAVVLMSVRMRVMPCSWSLWAVALLGQWLVWLGVSCFRLGASM